MPQDCITRWTCDMPVIVVAVVATAAAAACSHLLVSLLEPDSFSCLQWENAVGRAGCGIVGRVAEMKSATAEMMDATMDRDIEGGGGRKRRKTEETREMRIERE